jgi:hypothetical protein
MLTALILIFGAITKKRFDNMKSNFNEILANVNKK